MTNQEFFDRYALSIWKINNKNCMRACVGFLSRLGIDIEVDGEEVWQKVEEELAKIPDLTRRPDLKLWAFGSLSQWIHAAYPKFVDEIANGKRAEEVDLSTLRYFVPGPPNRNATRVGQNKHRSNLNVLKSSLNGNALRKTRCGAYNKLR